jgi:hypothetical protein
MVEARAKVMVLVRTPAAVKVAVPAAEPEAARAKVPVERSNILIRLDLTARREGSL